MAKIPSLRAKNWPTRRCASQTRHFLAALRLEFLNTIFQRRIFYNNVHQPNHIKLVTSLWDKKFFRKSYNVVICEHFNPIFS
jgi:hypothetical protein